MRVERFPENPLITPHDVRPYIDGWEVIGTFNAAVAQYKSETLLLVRVAERPVSDDPDQVLVPIFRDTANGLQPQILCFDKRDEAVYTSDPRVIRVRDDLYLTSISHLRVARSTDGRNFTVDTEPALYPREINECLGIEDPRITQIDDTYYAVYKAVSPDGIVLRMSSTKDFVSWEKHGVIFCPENMDAAIFPSKVRGRYAALHRPVPSFLGKPRMWLAYSDDLENWGDHRLITGTRHNTWECCRTGGGAVPFLTDRGWLEIYHAVSDTGKYCLGAMLLDSDYPDRVLAKSRTPILEPETPYEVDGFMPNVVFTCGAIVNDGIVTIYYGASDEVIAGVRISIDDIMAGLDQVA